MSSELKKYRLEGHILGTTYPNMTDDKTGKSLRDILFELSDCRVAITVEELPGP